LYLVGDLFELYDDARNYKPYKNQLLPLTSDDCDVRISKTPTKLNVQEESLEYEDQSLLGCYRR